jgi:hypothetical protein
MVNNVQVDSVRDEHHRGLGIYDLIQEYFPLTFLFF